MFNSQMKRIARKLSMLGILVVCLVMLSADFGGRSSFAAACCSTCDPAYDACVQGCGDPPSGACLFFCNNRYNRCLTTCDGSC